LRGVRGQLGAILIGAAWIFSIGLIDDLKPLGPRFKLAAQILSAIPLILGGVTIRGFLPIPALGWIVTIGWCVVLMNSFNFMDNMDGLCATVAAVIAVVLAIAAALGGQLLLPALFLSFAGILAGFLIFNFNPASIFLGDSGALTIGYLLAVFSILTTYYAADQPTGLPILIPLVVMGVPLFDTASVMFIRWRNGAPFMVGDHNHFSHRLRAMGFSVRQTALAIGALTGAIGLLSLALRYLKPWEAILHLTGIVLLFCVIGALEFVGRRNTKP
ncbi:undecaprenyl/decaprenyl-phosphate alpha-N-acetylglucosaminyl 1-phosphate transferase, partial [Candidatus Sumerlaeota bacterium]|nr:undecaprenyl/decaprenyl-phosphate alpha-N-acetylglucosaminyl 1-phosphate transferase [Candidatus Sumerlaeota bacterium]